MNRTLIALFFISSPPVLADHGFYVNLNSAFHPADAENSSTVDSFWETGVGFGHKEQVSDAWNAHYQMGVTTAKPEYSGVGDARTQCVYSRVLFEFNRLSDTVKPFAGVGLQKTFTSTDHCTDVKKSVGFNFYPEPKNYSINVMVSHSDQQLTQDVMGLFDSDNK